MGAPKDVAAALRSRLSGNTTMPVAWEGTPYIPDVSVPYLAASYLPAETETPALGSSFIRLVGIFQVSVCYPTGNGTGAAEVVADQLLSIFRRGTTIIQNGVMVQVEKSWRSTVIEDGAWIRIPVSVKYFSNLSV